MCGTDFLSFDELHENKTWSEPFLAAAAPPFDLSHSLQALQRPSATHSVADTHLKVSLSMHQVGVSPEWKGRGSAT